MINNYVYFSPNGEIRQVVSTPDPESCLYGDLSYMEGEANCNDDYIDTITRTIKPKMDFTLDTLPLPCVVKIENINYPVTETPVFEFDVPGVYEITVDAGPKYLEKTFSVTQT